MQITVEALRRLAPRASQGIIFTLAPHLDRYLPQYGITSPLRVSHFLAQAAHETDSFKTLIEYASGAAYQGRKDLGNVREGDGKRFKGRGIFQLTGRVNYEAYGRRLGIDIVANPDKACDPEVAVRVACEYWKLKGLNAWADRDDVVEITRRINGGRNGLSDRIGYLKKAKAIFGADVPHAAQLIAQQVPAEEVPDAPIAAEPAKKWWQSTEVMGTGATATAGIVGAINTPWAALAIALMVVIGAAAAWVIYRRMQREAALKPT